MWGELVTELVRGFTARGVNTDSTIFKLHYQVTFCILLIFAIILAANQYVGKPIKCMHHLDDKSDELLDTFCWIHSTYTLTSAFYKKVGVEVPYPGVDNKRGNEEEVKAYRFYQWVFFCLLFQAILFYAPRYLWKTWEFGKLQALQLDLNVGVMEEEDREQKMKILVDYLERNIWRHKYWAYKYFFCEFLALVNVIGQMFLMDTFLGGEFFTYGTEVIRLMLCDQEDRVDPMIYIFPRMTKCIFYKYGVSGEVERHDALCVLPLNIVNEKIFIFLWFWFIILATLTFPLIVYRILIIISHKFRVLIFKWSYGRIGTEDIEKLTRNCSFGSWYLLYMIGTNIDKGIFYEAVKDLAATVKRKISQSQLSLV